MPPSAQPGKIASACRLYWEWAERSLNIAGWEVMPVGVHFGSPAQPELFVSSVRRALSS
ncbi:MAG: hypothetical protein NTX29_02885 [Actinobacteria bacterium]|nr:hypothetical protein [Actinomycetota bacterium]